MSEAEKRSIDPATQKVLSRISELEATTIWDRYEAQQPKCVFGDQGLCCRLCHMGPCRISKKASVGVCGATADSIAARNLARMVAGGVAAHSDHGRDVAHAMLAMSKGEAADYNIRDPKKLAALAREYGVATEGKTLEQLAQAVGETALSEFGQQEGELRFAHRAPKARQDVWRKLGIMPRGIDREVVELLHRTTMGVDNDYRSIMRQAMRCALADGWGGSMITTDLQDAMLGSPEPIRARANLGVLKADQVNIVIHGHEPLLSDMIVEASHDPELLKLAKENGANGVNISGICCTAVEILMRRGVAAAGNFMQQELAIATGAVEVMVVDVQCLMPSLPSMARCFHTEVITTSPKARLPGVKHIEFSLEHALDCAKEIVRTAIENFPNREPASVQIPDEKMDLVAGFTSEYVHRLLGGRFRPSYRPLNDAIIMGRIRGVAGVVGCTSPDVLHDYGHVTMVKELIKNDVLVVQTGCAATACAKVGLLTPEAAREQAGRGLAEVCEAVGMPPVLHVGACVDNSRILVSCCEILREGGLGEDISDLPVAGAAPEWMSEKAVAIGLYVIASGIYTVFGQPLPVMGSQAVADYLTGGLAEDVGACWAFEADPVKAAHMMIEHMNQKRKALKLQPMMYPPQEEKVAVGA